MPLRPIRLLPLLLLLLALGACRSALRPTDVPAPAGEAAATVKQPDTYTVATALWWTSVFDPAVNYGVDDGGFILSVYDALLTFDGESTEDFLPRLATTVPSVDNGLIRDGGRTIEFPIRHGPRFQAGPVEDAAGRTIPGSGELSPEDLAYSFQRGMLADPANGPQWLLLAPILGVTSILDLAKRIEEAGGGKPASEVQSLDDMGQATLDAVCETVKSAVTVEGDSLVFHLVEPYAPFLKLMVGPWAVALDKEWVATEIVDADGQVVKKAGWNGECDTWRAYYGRQPQESELHDVMNGTGAYRLERSLPNEGITLLRNDDYWRGPGRLRQIVYQLVPEFSTRLLMLQVGDADVIAVPGPNVDQLQPLVAQGLVRETKATSGNAMSFFGFNQKVVAENNPYIGSGKLDGKGIPPDFFGDLDVRKAFCHVFDWDQVIQASLNGDAVRARGPIPSSVSGFDPDWPSHDHDLAKAEAHFREAMGGRLWEVGFTVLMPGDPNEPPDPFDLDLTEINPKFKVERYNVTGGQAWEDRVADRIPLNSEWWTEDFHDPDDWVQPLLGTNGIFASLYDFEPGLQAQLDDLILQARREQDPSRRQEIYSRIGMLSYEQALIVPAFEPRARSFERSWVQGIVRNAATWDPGFHAMYKAVE